MRAKSVTEPISPAFSHCAEWLERLQRDGHALISDLPCDPDNHSLREIAATLGQASLRSISRHPQLWEEGGVQRVQAIAQPASNRFGRRLRSSDAESFPLHTDESFLTQPARWVLLHCWQPDPEGGGSSLICERTALSKTASTTQIGELRQRMLRYPCGRFPVIAADDRLRFNADDCQPESDADRGWLQEVADLAATAATTISLRRGDCLIMDNHRVMHGRLPFAENSPGLLKRIRVI